jgi:hypothetical protein
MRRGGITPKDALIRSVRAPCACAAALAVFAAASGVAMAADPSETPGVRLEASYNWDNNVNRGTAADTLKDWTLGVRATVTGAVSTSTHTRLIAQGFLGTERFHTYNGLSRNFVGAQGDFQYRGAGDFGRATYGAFVRAQAEEYESTLRDGYRYALGVSVLKPWTDRIQLFAALTENITDGSSVVFDTKSTSLRGNVDWSLNNWNVIYLGADYRHGDSVSSLCRNCDLTRTAGLVNTAAPNIVQDDAFNDTVRDAYKLKANTWVFTLGYNHALTGRQSLDLSWRRVLSKGLNPVAPATQSDINYYVTQYSVAYLARF